MAMERGKLGGFEMEKEKMENVAMANGTKVARRTKRCLKDYVLYPSCHCQCKL